jgi:hypothetical protein
LCGKFTKPFGCLTSLKIPHLKDKIRWIKGIFFFSFEVVVLYEKNPHKLACVYKDNVDNFLNKGVCAYFTNEIRSGILDQP